MKPFTELTTEDFRRSPVWSYQSPHDDADAAVEEDRRSELSERDTGVFVAATTFRLANGSELAGLCSPVDPSGLDYLQPVLFAEGGQLPLWSDSRAVGPAPEAICRELGRPISDVFPLSFTCHVPVDGTLVSGTIDVARALPNQALQLTVNLPPFGQSDDRR
jgi:hypothetical protein